MSELRSRRCVPCEGDVPRLTPDEARILLPETPGWELFEDRELRRSFHFSGFLDCIAFVNRMAKVADDEGHHPDFSVHYDRLDVRIWTHAIDGLSKNDFILAAKIDALPR